MLSPDKKGSIAEAAITLAATRLDIGVLKPVTDGLRYDLVFDTGSRLLRIQCKWAVRRREVVIVNGRTCRRGRDGFVRSGYTREEVDLIAAYCPDTDRCYAVGPDVFEGHPIVSLRLAPTLNNQRAGCAGPAITSSSG